MYIQAGLVIDPKKTQELGDTGFAIATMSLYNISEEDDDDDSDSFYRERAEN